MTGTFGFKPYSVALGKKLEKKKLNILLQIQPCTSTNKQRTYTQFWFLQLTSMNQQELIHLADSHYLTDPVHHQYFLAPDFHAKQRNRRWNC